MRRDGEGEGEGEAVVAALGLTIDEDGLVESLQPFSLVYACTVTAVTNLSVASPK